MRVCAVVGMQFGSEAKGHAIGMILDTNYNVFDTSVRVQSIQAGHTVYYRGKPYKMRTIPCAWVKRDIFLVLGPGIFIDRDLLIREIDMVTAATGEDIRDRLKIDYRAFFVETQDVVEEQSRNIESGIGSTAHGCGSSLIRKMWRNPSNIGQVCSAHSWLEEHNLTKCLCDTIEFNQDKNILLEICQGTMLSIHTSPYYPFVSTREATVVGACAEAGISHRDIYKVIGVARTCPIRVGGNSGLTGGRELTWEEISKRAGYEVEPEKTTVTQRVRRIFEWSDADFIHAARVNKPDEIVLTFVNYLAPCYGINHSEDLGPEATRKISRFVNRLRDLPTYPKTKVSHLGTGELAHHWITL